MMKRQLNPLRIGKGLLCLLALFMMLLAPQGAWAEDYALTIAGQQYTDEQLKSTITLTSTQSTYITGGSITITPASNSDPVKLTFDNVTLSSNIVSNIDLEVYLIGGSEISYSPSMNNPDPCFKGNNNSLIFTTSETNPGTLFITKTSSMDDFASGWGGDSTTPIWDEDCDNEPNGYYWWVDQSCGYMYLKVNKKYDLEMNGSQVCDAMFKKLFPYADFPSIYMSDAQTLVVYEDYEYPITSNMSALTVAVAGKVTLSSIRFASKGSVTSGTLTISKYTNSSSNEVSLTLNNTKDSDPSIYGFSSVSISDPMTVKTPNPAPDNWDTYNDEIYISNYVSYGITVGGEEVTDKNAENIFNDDNPSAVFDNTTSTLTFNNINVERLWDYSPFIVNGRGNLIIQIEGTQNNIKCGSQFIAKSNASASDYTVTITTDQNNRGKLTYTTYSSEFSSGHKVIFNNGLGWKKSGPDSESHYNMTIDQTGYDLSVGGESVTSNNASNITGDYITGDGTVSYDPVTNTLTLNNATIVVEQGDEPNEFPCISYSGSTDLTIKLLGSNKIENKAGISAIRCNSEEPGSLTFSKGNAQPCSLELSSEEGTIIEGFKSVDGVNGINSVKGNFLMLTNDDNIEAHYYYFNDNDNEKYGLFTTDDEDGEIVSNATITSGYGILVAEKLVYEGNADNVLGDELENHMVKFNATNNTLTLNDANLADGSINYSGTEDLTIAIAGNSKLFSINYVNDEVNDIPELTITKASGATDCSLALNSNGDGSVISGFSALNYGTFNTISSAPINYGKIDPAENYVCLFDAVTNVWMSDVTFTTATTYPLWVGGNQVTGVNADDLFDDGGNEQTPTVSFTPANTTTTPATPATLTLTNATLGSVQTASVDIVSSLPSLVIELSGENTLVGSVVSLNSEATLAFKGDGTIFLNNNNPVSGFSGTPTGVDDCDLVYLYNGTYAYVKKLDAPVISSLNGTATHIRLSTEEFRTNFSGGVIKYSITYPDVETPVTGEYPTRPDADNESGLALDQPLTIEAWVEYQGKTSATKMGKCFGFKTSSVTVEKGKSIDIPEIVPAYNADDKLVFAFQSADPNIATVDAQTNKITGAKTGTTTVTGNVTYSGETPLSYQILNYSGNLSNLEITVLKDPEFCFYVGETISNGDTESYIYGEEQTLPALKRWDNGSLKDPTGFNVTYTSSAENVATIDNDGKITIVGVGLTEIRASIEATEEYAADEAWFTMMVVPAVPQVSIPDGAYFTGQKLSITTDAQGGDLYYSYGYEEDESKRTPYDGEISLPAGEYQFYPYVRCGTVDNPIWSYTEATELYVYDEPTISKDAGEYEGDIEVEITNLPHSDNVSVTAYYYLGDDDDDEKNDILYTAGDKITVRESTKLNVYLLVEGDSGKRYKTRVIERQYVIKDIPLDVTAADFHNHWMTYYHNNNGNVALPENQNIGAYVATGISGNEIVVTQIKSIPRGEPVLLNDETTTTTTNVFGQDVQGNLLLHADEDLVVDEEQGDYYGLYNGAFMRVKGTIPAGKNYLLVSNAVVPGGNAPQLTIVIDGEATGVNGVRSKMEDVRGDIYDLQGRKVQKPSKKGLYINKGHKVVVK